MQKANKKQILNYLGFCYCNLLCSEAFAKPSYLDKKNKNKYQNFIQAVVFAKSFLESLDRYRYGSKRLVVAEEESEGCPGKNIKLLSSDFGFAFNLSIFTFLSY